MLSMLDRKEYLSKQHWGCPCEHHLPLKTECEKACANLNTKLKREYAEESLRLHKNNPKQLWHSIRRLWPHNKNTKISDLLNEHLCKVGERVHSQISTDTHITDFDIPYSPPIFDLKPITDKDLKAAINRLSATKSYSLDGITSEMIKDCKGVLGPILLHILNR